MELELGRRIAGATVWLLALFPAAVYFGAPYSESLFLLVSVGAFYAARTGRWAWAGALAAAASATRSAGLVLLVPLFLFWLESRPRRPGALAWLALAPLGLAAYALHLGLAHGDALAFLDAQEAWFRDFAGPFVGVWDGTTAAWDGVRQLVERVATGPSTSSRAGGDPYESARDQRPAVRIPRVRRDSAWSAPSGGCRSRTGRTRSPRSRCRSRARSTRSR